MDDTMRVFVVRGSVEPRGELWASWLLYAEQLAQNVGFPATHVSVAGESFHSDKVLVLSRLRKKILHAAAGQAFEWLSLYSLPVDFQTAIFDYEILSSRSLEQASVAVPSNIGAALDGERLLQELTRFVKARSIEVFDMSRREVPALYLSGAQPPESFSTLRILKKEPVV